MFMFWINIYIYTHIYINKCKKRSFSNCIYVSCIYIYIHAKPAENPKWSCTSRKSSRINRRPIFAWCTWRLYSCVGVIPKKSKRTVLLLIILSDRVIASQSVKSLKPLWRWEDTTIVFQCNSSTNQQLLHEQPGTHFMRAEMKHNQLNLSSGTPRRDPYG